ncbi:hypothetical protein PF005_g30174 [Phytophthora fragariae]|uniref:Uncharacterized protein n=1 Tax=Phytophthora fragariae TaxID=53985 RepID=A0A6A3VDQ0_9STRA|nr:hypothetical protein PF005_g30174 [Phytophthora fragariae]
MALQSTPTFQVAFRWLEGFYEALNAGDVVAFTERDDSAFPGLSQVSSVGGARLSQLSFANGETPEDQGSADIDEDVVDNGVEVDIAVDVSSDMKAEQFQVNKKIQRFMSFLSKSQMHNPCVSNENKPQMQNPCVSNEKKLQVQNPSASNENKLQVQKLKAMRFHRMLPKRHQRLPKLHQRRPKLS